MFTFRSGLVAFIENNTVSNLKVGVSNIPNVTSCFLFKATFDSPEETDDMRNAGRNLKGNMSTMLRMNQNSDDHRRRLKEDVSLTALPWRQGVWGGGSTVRPASDPDPTLREEGGVIFT